MTWFPASAAPGRQVLAEEATLRTARAGGLASVALQVLLPALSAGQCGQPTVPSRPEGSHAWVIVGKLPLGLLLVAASALWAAVLRNVVALMPQSPFSLNVQICPWIVYSVALNQLE